MPATEEIARIQAAMWSYVVFAFTVTLVKIVALVTGYLVAKLGYNTMMAGVQGKDSLEVGALGTKLKFKGVTPGLALGVVGVLMMAWALSTKSQFSAEASNFAKQNLSAASGEVNRDSKGTTSQPDVAKPFK